MVKKTVVGAVWEIMKKYPDADNESIFCTLVKNGYDVKLKSVSTERAGVLKELRIRKQMGVK